MHWQCWSCLGIVSQEFAFPGAGGKGRLFAIFKSSECGENCEAEAVLALG